MITCHRKYLEQRCLERGRDLAAAMPCVVAMDGDMWTINVDHASYPDPDVGALSFKCVPDCTTPEFACEQGFCCEENPFDGTNSCLPCPSRNTGCLPQGASGLGEQDSDGCSEALTADTVTYPYEGPCQSCIKIWSCDNNNGPTFLRWDVASNIVGPDEYDDAGIQSCVQRNTGCLQYGFNGQGESDPEPCKSIYTTDTGTYPNAGSCGNCHEIYYCSQQSGSSFARWDIDPNNFDYLGGEYNPDLGLSCDQYFNCDPMQGCFDLGYDNGIIANNSQTYKGTCANSTCELRNTGCVVTGLPTIVDGCLPFYSTGSDLYYGQNQWSLPEMGSCDPTCLERSECNSTNPYSGCSILGYYTDSNVPSGQDVIKSVDCGDTSICFKIYSCDPTNGPTFLRWGTSLGPDEYDDTTIQDCIERNTGCVDAGVTDPADNNNTVGCYSQFSTSSIAPDGGVNNGPCNPDCVLRNTGCLPNGLSNLGKDDSGACSGALYTTDSTTYPVQDLCPTCVRVWSCDPQNGPAFLRWDVASNIVSGEYDDTTIQDCIERNTGCLANGFNNQGESDPEPCKSTFTTDATTYPNTGTCDPDCVKIYTCDNTSGKTWNRWGSQAGLSIAEFTEASPQTSCQQYYNCNYDAGCTDIGYQLNDMDRNIYPYLPYPDNVQPGTCATGDGVGNICQHAYSCTGLGGCEDLGYYNTTPGASNQNGPFSVWSTGFCSDGKCNLRNTGCIQNGVNGDGMIGCDIVYVHDSDSSGLAGYPELGPCDTTCLQRSECNSTDPNASTGCQNLGYYTDSTVPSSPDVIKSADCSNTSVCFKIYSCDPTNGSTFVRWGTSLGPDEYDDTTIQDCTQRNTGCVPNGFNNQGASDPEPCKSIYTTDTTTYPNAGVCGACYAIYNCDQQSGGQFARWQDDYFNYADFNGEYAPDNSIANSCDQYFNCEPYYGCSDLGYNTGFTLPQWAHTFTYKGTCSDGSCVRRNTGCVNQGVGNGSIGCVDGYGLDSSVNIGGTTYNMPEMGDCDPSCQLRYECYASADQNATLGCKDVGFHTDSTAPSGSSLGGATTGNNCDTSVCFKIWSCDPTNGPTFLRWGTSLGPDEYDDAGIQDCVPRWTYCDGQSGSTPVGYSTDTSLPTSQTAECVEWFECTQSGCQRIMFDVPQPPNGITGSECQDCIVRNTGCIANGANNQGADDSQSCVSQYSTDSTTYPVTGTCPTCVKVWSCDAQNGPAFLRWDLASNIGSGEYDDVGIQECAIRNSGCDPTNGCIGYGGVQPPWWNPSTSVWYSTDTNYPKESEQPCSSCIVRNTGCISTGCTSEYSTNTFTHPETGTCQSCWGAYVCRKQTLQNAQVFGGAPTSYYTCITNCDTSPGDCDSQNYPHHCNQSGNCGEPTLPEQCDGYPLDSSTTYVSECYNVNSCAECS